MTLSEALAAGRVLLGDGANGTCLAELGYSRQPYDLAVLESPQLLQRVHAAYFAAGSDFVETNTFQANAIRMAGFDHDLAHLNRESARLARQAASGMDRDTYVLGAIGPTGKPIEPIGHISVTQVQEAIHEQAQALLEGGVDGFILETFIDLEELRAAVAGVRSVSDLPIFASKAFIEDGEMLAEGLAARAASAMAEMGVNAVGANCIVGPQRMLDIVRQIAESTDLPILAFPTPGMPQIVKGQVTYDAEPEYFAKAALRLVEAGARIVGGCCGTTPGHIQALRAALDGFQAKVATRSSVRRELKARLPLTETEPTALRQKLGAKFVTAVEMDVPRGLNLSKLVQGAISLKNAGVDVINISDGARARLRINPTAVSQIIQSQVGIEVTMHFSCRDRNLLAIQSDLLGAHALGIRNILAVTGDPATIGDYPSATSVFDVDAIGLCRILSRFNEGVDFAGNSVGVKCGFTVACAYNPEAQDQAFEDDRLRRKVDAGAHVVYTQPVFGPEAADRAAALCCALHIPLLVGVLPLRSGRHAEFMHNEVPGISVPARLRDRIANAADDGHALEIGIEEARQLATRIREIAQGLYLMPPFGSAEIAERVMAT